MARYLAVGEGFGNKTAALRKYLPEVTATMLCLLVVGTVLRGISASEDGRFTSLLIFFFEILQLLISCRSVCWTGYEWSYWMGCCRHWHPPCNPRKVDEIKETSRNHHSHGLLHVDPSLNQWCSFQMHPGKGWRFHQGQIHPNHPNPYLCVLLGSICHLVFRWAPISRLWRIRMC